LSETLLDSVLSSMKGKKDEEQLIAPCFLALAEEMQTTYTHYCINNDNSLALLLKARLFWSLDIFTAIILMSTILRKNQYGYLLEVNCLKKCQLQIFYFIRYN